MPAATAVKELIAGLGLPTSLRALKVDAALLPRVAEAAMANLWVRTNPRPITGPAAVREILDLAW